MKVFTAGVGTGVGGMGVGLGVGIGVGGFGVGNGVGNAVFGDGGLFKTLFKKLDIFLAKCYGVGKGVGHI